jgi:tetratricopeptide (TPR) repeat protein
VAHYRQRCLECHQQQGCSVPEATRRLTSKEDSCIDCHMPRFPPADIAHTSATDHRILRRKERDPGSAANDQPGPPRTPGIVSFYPDHRDINDPEARRDLGIALSHIRIQNLTQHKPPLIGDGDLAIELLEAAVRNDPEDLPAWEALAEALALRDRTAEALTAYEYVLSKAPRREASLMGAAMLAQQQRLESALSYWRRAVAVDPWKATYRSSLAKMLAEHKAWDEALLECQAWVRLDPANIDARVLLVTCLARTGDKTTARAEFAKIERLRPPNLPLLQARFSVALRPR